MIVADTGAVVALIDADDRHHAALRTAYERDPDAWVLPWAILPEVDHIVASKLGAEAARTFRRDVAEGAFPVEWSVPADLARTAELDVRYADLRLGLVDAVVMATPSASVRARSPPWISGTSALFSSRALRSSGRGICRAARAGR